MTEKYLSGCFIFDNRVLQEALMILDKEIHPNINPPEPSPFFRKKLALSLFYKVSSLVAYDLDNFNFLFNIYPF